MALNWTEEAFSVPYLSDQVEFPQLVKVASLTGSVSNINSLHSTSCPSTTQSDSTTHSHPQLTSADHCLAKTTASANSLRVGDTLKLHGARTFKKAVLTGASRFINGCEEVATEYGYLSPPGSTSIYRQYSVPISFSTPLKVLPYQDPQHVYHTAGDIINEKPRPKSVVVNKKIVLAEKHCTIKEGDVLAIISADKRCTNSGVVDFLICKHNDKTVGLPTTCVGDFTVNCEETLYSLSNVVEKHMEFPQRVCFQPSDSSTSLCQTLIRGGENLIVPGEEYVIENVIKQQYLICTKCEENVALGQTKLYFIPTNSTLSRRLLVHLPLFHDIKSYRLAVNSLYCTNLSMKNIVDCTPIEAAGDPKLVIRKLGDVYDSVGPELPPRKETCDSTANGLQDEPYVGRQSMQTKSQGQKDRFGRRLNASESNLAGMTLADVTLAGHQDASSQKYVHSEQISCEDQPLLGENSSSRSKFHTESSNGTPVFSRRGTSTPCTPESRRRKTDSPQTWSEKISMSLENLKRAFRKPGSDERDKPTKIGDGSQLADSFENLSMANESDFAQNLQVHSSNYENVKLVAAQLNKAAGRPRLTVKNPVNSCGGAGTGAILQSRCSQIKEIWTPPCSPDYRDHTTSYLQQHPAIPAGGLQQFNNSNSNQLLSPVKTADQVNVSNDRKPSTTADCTVFNFSSPDSSNHHVTHRSPIAAPRQSKDNLQSLSASALYENIEAAVSSRSTPSAGLTPPSRCSGYSSGSRASSENDLITASQLDTSTSCSTLGDSVPESLSSLSVSGLAECLRLFELPNVAHKFKQHQIDGQFFNIMSDHMFRDENFSFSEFEILKLKRLRDGWRPRLS